MSLARFSVRRPVTVQVFFIALVVLGAVGLLRLPQELFPPISFPEISIVTHYFNAAPEEIENQVTRPIEEAIGSVSGLRRVSSSSREGRSVVTAAFDWGTHVDFASLAVREKLDLIKERLPRECDEPLVVKYDPLARPILILALSGRLARAELKEVAVKSVKERLEQVKGVASASVSGGVDREIVVEVDQGLLRASGHSILQVADALEAANVTYPAGTLTHSRGARVVRTAGEFRNLSDIEQSAIGAEESALERRVETSYLEVTKAQAREASIETKREEARRAPWERRLITMGEIAKVRDTLAEVESFSRLDGRDVITISVQKQAGANTIDLAGRLKQELASIRTELARGGSKINLIYDHSEFIRKAIAGVRDDALQGAALAFFVVLVSLRSWVSALLVCVSLPLCVMVVFFVMFLQGLTLNIMSLGGLALGVGMVTDSCICVLDNIFQKREAGAPPAEAAVQGTDEVLWPVVSSALTTNAVFIPLIVFVPGVPGQLFKDLSWTVVIANTATVLVALMLVPPWAARIRQQAAVKTRDLAPYLKGFLALPRPRQAALLASTVLGAFLVFAGALAVGSRLEREVLPKMDQGKFLINLTYPIGTRLEATDRNARRLEDLILKEPEVEHVAATVGSESTGALGEVVLEARGPHEAQLLVMLKRQRSRSSAQVLEAILSKLPAEALGRGVLEPVLQESEFQVPGAGADPVAVEVKGHDFAVLADLAGRVEKALAGMDGVVRIRNDRPEAAPERKVAVDRRRAVQYGIAPVDISLTAQAAIEGTIATVLREGGKETDIRVRLRKEDQDQAKVSELLVFSELLKVMVPVKEVATVSSGSSPSEILRRDQQRTVTVSAGLAKGYALAPILARLRSALEGIPAGEGYTLELRGEAREIRESFGRVFFALALSLALVYMIMASQFDSLLQPLIIMATIPLSVIGVVAALAVTGRTVNVISILGVIMLGGVVVNNGIVLLDFMNAARREGRDVVSAAVQGIHQRMRPILMTAATTVIGLLPLALGAGEGSELRAPLAVTVIGGLLSSTFLSLFVVPAIYVLVEKSFERGRGPAEVRS